MKEEISVLDINKQNAKKNFLWNSIGSTLNAFSSLFFLIIVARVNGIFDAGIFTFGFSLATLLSYIGLYHGRVYQVADNSHCKDIDFINTKYVTCFIMLALGLIFIMLRGYSTYKTLIVIFLCMFKVLEAFFDGYYAIFQKNGLLYKVGVSQTAKALIELTVFITIDLVTKNLFVAVLSLIISNLVVFIFYDIPNRNKLKIKKGFNKANIIYILKKGMLTFLITFFTMYLSNAAKYVIDFLLADNYQTIYGIIIMPATVIVLFAQYMIQPYIINIKENYLKKNYQEVKTITFKIIRSTILFGILAIVLGYFLGTQVLGFIYNVNIDSYRTSFTIILLGAVFYGINIIYSNILMAINKNKEQTLMFFITSILMTYLSYILISNLNLFGACLAYTISLFPLLIMLKLLIANCLKGGE